MYKIPDQVVQLIEKTIETWKVELTAGGHSSGVAKVQRGIFQGDAQSPLIFVIVTMPLHHILRKYTAGYKLRKSQDPPLDVHGQHQTVYQKRKLWEYTVQI